MIRKIASMYIMLICARPCSKHFTRIISTEFHNNPNGCYRQEDRGTEKVPKVVQQGFDAGIQART